VLKPVNEEEIAGPKEVHVVLKYGIHFILSKPVSAKSLRAEFLGTMNVMTYEGDSQFREAETTQEEITRMKWSLWKGSLLEAGQEYLFHIAGELPDHTLRSLRTPKGKIEYTLTVWLEGVSDRGKMRHTRKMVEVWNPFSMNADDPRPGLEFHAELDDEMVGCGIELEKDFEAFVRYPDQCFKGRPLHPPDEASGLMFSRNGTVVSM